MSRSDTESWNATMFTTPGLIAANHRAVHLGLNRALTDEFTDELDPLGKHVVGFTMLHNDASEIRAEVWCKVRESDEPVKVWIDVPIDEWDDYATPVTFPKSDVDEEDDEIA